MAAKVRLGRTFAATQKIRPHHIFADGNRLCMPIQVSLRGKIERKSSQRRHQHGSETAHLCVGPAKACPKFKPPLVDFLLALREVR